MTTDGFRYVYGPVPSRRLGRSLGIDLVPFKTCTYDCIYCQLGRTTNKTLECREYVPTADVLAELKRKLSSGDRPDYVSLAGSGEPTLNSGIARVIEGIKKLTDLPVAILTNGGLLWMKEVRRSLRAADLVIPSLDAGNKRLFEVVNRPHPGIAFERMVEGLAEFSREFSGKVWLEVFLLAGLTGTPSQAVRIAALVKDIAPDRVQLNTVCRPPVEPYALALSPDKVNQLKRVFKGKVDVISENPPDAAPVSATGMEEEDILALLSRRQCTAADVASGLGMHLTEALKYLRQLTVLGEVKLVAVKGRSYYVLNRQNASSAEEKDIQ